MTIALGIDFEDITQIQAGKKLDNTGKYYVDLQRVTRELLDLFEEYGKNVTFFIVSELAQEFPETVREIANRGHEIASHTRSHRSIIDLGEDDLREEILTSKSELESVIGQPVRGFRAPTCRINDRAYQVLIEAGFTYSSSVMPSVPIPGFYSASNAHADPVRITNGSGSLVEYPVTVAPGVRLPVAGAWIRLLGRQYTLSALRRKSKTGIVCTYTHPWEFRSMPSTVPFRGRFRTGKWMYSTYQQILSLDREFVTCSELHNRIDSVDERSV